MDDNDESFNERVVYTGEVYMMCSECGARLYSIDATPGMKHDIVRGCPYKSSFSGKCEPKDERRF